MQVETVHENDKRQARRHRAIRERSKSPHVVGIAPRSAYGEAETDRAISQALEGARGNIRPTPVIADRRCIGVAHGIDPSSPHARFVPLRKGHKPSERQRLIDDLTAERYERVLEAFSEPLHAMPFTTGDQITDSLSSGKFRRQFFAKTPSSAAIAANWYDYAPVAGNPSPIAITGTARTAVRFDDTSAGAIWMGGNVSTDTKHLLAMMAIASANTPMLMPYDRVIAYDQCTFSTSNQTFTNTLTAQRYNAGAPGLLPVMVTNTVLGATVFSLTRFAFTDDAGNASDLMPTTTTVSGIVSAAAPSTTLGARVFAPSTSANTFCWGYHLPIGANNGVRLAEDYTWSAANTGTFTLILLHPLAYLIVPLAAVPTEKDVAYQMPELERVFDGACVSLMGFMPVATAISTLQGTLSHAWHA